VIATCLVIVIVLAWPARLGDQGQRAGGAGSWRWDVVGGGWLMICSWILIAGPVLALPVAAVAPPLLVSAFEWSSNGTRTLALGIRRWLLVVGAALAGSMAVKLAPAASIAGLAGVGATVVLMRVLATPHPPALAISIIPWIAGPIGPWNFTAGTAVGAAALYVIGDLIARARIEVRRRPTITARATLATTAPLRAIRRERRTHRGPLDLDKIGETQ
jgi:hypothetical protein